MVLKNPIRNAKKAERITLLRSLLGGACINCGSIDNLHFDHVLPEDKSFNFWSNWDCSLERLLPELQKCQLLCSPCHAHKTAQDNGFTGYKHGTYSMYTGVKCRCVACKTANAIYKLENKRNRRLA